MKNDKIFFEINGFYFGSIAGGIIYLILILKIFFIFICSWDMSLAGIIGIALGCVVGGGLFIFLSAKIGQIIGLLIRKYTHQINVKREVRFSSLLNLTIKESNITTNSNVIYFPGRSIYSTHLRNKSI